MERNLYRLGLLVGRFQGLHNGHVQMIDTALALCDRVCVFVGSSQEARTEKNPFSYAEREELLRAVYGDRLIIRPLPDIGVGNNAAWGEYVLSEVRKSLGELPDLFVTGKEARRVSWFDGTAGEGMAELHIPKTVAVSATELRGMLLRGEKEAWEAVTPPALRPFYSGLREALLASQGNRRTDSL